MRTINLSVIIPVYNAAAFLERCLSSVLSQTLRDIEVICINDGSTDGSLSILRKFAKENANLVVLDQKNAGPSAARNRGISIAQGKYIAFVDSDDYVEPDMYEHMVFAAEIYGLDVVLCNYINDYADRPSNLACFGLPDACVIEKQTIKENIYPELMKDGIFNGPCNKIYRSDFLKSLNTKMPEDLRYGEDLIFQLEVYDKLERTYFINKPFYHYVHRENSLSTANRNMLERVLIPMYNIRKEYAAKWELSEEKTAEYFVYYSLMDMVNSIRGAQKNSKIKTLMRYLRNPVLSEAVQKAHFLAGNYTKKIKLLYLGCFVLGKRKR